MNIPIQGICPLLQVYDMNTSVAFYRTLGFELIAQAPDGDEFDWCWLKRESMEIMLNTLYEREHRPSAPDLARQSAHGDTALFFACNELNALYLYLQSNGITAKPPAVAPYGMNQLWLNDPDGYTLCFQHRVAETT